MPGDTVLRRGNNCGCTHVHHVTLWLDDYAHPTEQEFYYALCKNC